jgi:predicted HicB family RNase H-like nuclease
MMEYKGYVARVEYDSEADLFHGEVVNTRPVLTFQGQSTGDLKRELAATVDDYLAWCAERGKDPEKPFSGKILIRVPHALHRNAIVAAARDGKSLNAWTREVLERATADV